MGFSESRITTLPRTGSSAGWRDSDRLLLSISTVRAMLWAHQQSAPRHSLRPWGKQNHRSVLINGPSVCKTLQAVKLLSALSVDVPGIWWQLGGAWRWLSQNNGFCFWVSTWLDGHRSWYVSHCDPSASRSEQPTSDWPWLYISESMCENMSWQARTHDGQRVTIGQCVSITQPGLCKMVCALVLLVKHNTSQIFLRIIHEEWLELFIFGQSPCVKCLSWCFKVSCT